MKRTPVTPDRDGAPGSRPMAEATADDAVRGERGRPVVSTTRSLQSRVSSIMACGLMIILGGGMLTWYYTNALSRQSHAKRDAQTAVSHRAQAEMPLPALDGLNILGAAAADLRHEVPDTQGAAQHPFAESKSPASAPPEQFSAPEPSQLPMTLSQANWAPAGHG